MEELEAQVTYLRTQLGQLLEEKRRWVHSPTPSHPHEPVVESEEEVLHSRANSSDEEAPRIQKQGGNIGGVRIDIPEFEGQLGPDLFLDWLHTIERIFEYEDIPEDKKVKLVALSLIHI